MNSSSMKQGDWLCPECNAHNFAFRKDCFKCKGSATGSKAPNTSSKRNDDRNYKKSSESSDDDDNDDGRKYKSKEGAPRVKKGDFFCSKCGAHNFASRDRCYKCNKNKDPELDQLGHREVKNGDWFCEKCNFHNFASRATCFKCEDSSHIKKSNRDGDKECPKCNFNNFAHRTVCNKCNEPLNGEQTSKEEEKVKEIDRDVQAVIQAKLVMKQGDWMCPECEGHNFATRNQCFKCKQARPEEK